MKMKKIQLAEKLKQMNIRKDSYSLNGGLPNEAFCLNMHNNVWEVYYSERGSKSGLKIFYSEEEACEYFYEWLVKTFKRMKLMD